MVPLFCDIDGTHLNSDANCVEKWNESTICTKKNGMRSLPHGASHREQMNTTYGVCLTP